MNGNGELTATYNVIFHVSYEILTDKRNSYVFLKLNTEIRMNGYVILETGHYSLSSLYHLQVYKLGRRFPTS